ncbi:MAG: hypothetical protein JNN13_09350 [Planctomycetes bacterium]|nr:hypothetical protein [Planctomycetota bacterium]
MVLRKDLPWLLVTFGLGLITLSAAICEHSFERVFLVGAARHEALFHAAWILGVVVGLTGAMFDQVLGTREFLWQRPVSPARLALARLVAVNLVVAACLLLAPFGAWLGMLVFDDTFVWGHLDGLGELWQSGIGIVSGAMIGLFAGSLPVGWLLRLVIAAAAFGAVFVPIGALAGSDQVTAKAPFVLGHLGAAGLFAWGAVRAMQVQPDADRPWVARGGRPAASIAVLAVLGTWTLVASEFESTWLHQLEGEYPELFRRGDGVVLVRNEQAGGGEYRTVIVDERHQEVAAPPGPKPAFGAHLQVPSTWRRSDFEVEAPLWLGRHSWWVGYFDFGGRVFIDRRGNCWTRSPGAGLRRTGVGAAHAALPAGSVVLPVGTQQRLQAVAADPASGATWWFDAAAQVFVPKPLPDGDRFVEFDYYGPSPAELATLAEPLRAAFTDSGRWLVHGQQRRYVLHEGQWLGFDLPRRNASTASVTREGDDPVTFGVAVVGEGGAAPWRHTFTPQTWSERGAAAIAMLAAVVRPPLLQVAGSFASSSSRPWLVDALVVSWRRPWLTAASVGLALLLALFTRRRLSAYAAEPAMVRFWMLTMLLGGLPAVLCCEFFETRRAHARRALPGPFPAPRITSEVPPSDAG